MTGATGFVGRHLVQRLTSEGWRVKALVRREDHELPLPAHDVALGDVLDAASLRDASLGVDVMFHLAGQASVTEAEEAPADALAVNVTGTRNALEACRANGIGRFVFLSTMHVFGPSPGTSGAFDPRSVYAASKLDAERLVLDFGQEGGVETVVLRPSNVYGPGQASDAVVPDFVARALAGDPLVPQAAEVRRRFLYVDDLVDALVQAALAPDVAGHAFNVEAADTVSIGDLARLIERAVASPEPASFMGHASVGPAPAGGLPGWARAIPLSVGIARTVAAARATGEAAEPVPTAGEPRVSIVIPVYNGGDFLAEAIDSALGQTYRNLEVVVVNDGSTDGGATAAVAARYGGRIRYIEKSNGGVATALNAGIAAMDGELFSWLSHDDLYHPGKIEEEVRALREAGRPHLVFCDYEIMSEAGEPLHIVELGPQRLAERPLDGLLTGRFNGCTFLIPRQTLLELGGFKVGLPTTQDYELWFRIARRLPFLHVPRTLVRQRVHPAQGSRTPAHLPEADCLMISMIDRTPPEQMVAYDGSVERFLIRVARSLAQSPYAGAANYAAFRVRQALLQLPHTLVLTPPAGTLGETLAAIRREPGPFPRRCWLILTADPFEAADGDDCIALRRAASAPTPADALALEWAGETDLAYVGPRPPSTSELLAALETLISGDEAVVDLSSPPGEPSWLLRASRRDEAMRHLSGAMRDAHPAGSPDRAAEQRTALGLPNLPAKSLTALGRPFARLNLALGFRLLRTRSLRRTGARLIRHTLRRAGLAHVIDEPWYRATYGLVGGSGLRVWVDYLATGWSAGREPNPWFHGSFYVQRAPDWNRREAPLRHFLTRGAPRGLPPHPKFADGPCEASAYVPPDAQPQARGPSVDPLGREGAVSLLAQRLDPDRPTVLLCLHSWGGGTLTHAGALAEALARFANVLFLFGGDGRPFVLSDTAAHPPQGIAFERVETGALAQVLEALGVDHVDVHHAIGFEAELEDLLVRLGLPFDVTLVDYHLVAHQPHLSGRDGRFVGEGAPSVALLREPPLPLYAKAARRIAISRDMAQRLRALRPEFEVIAAANWLKPPIEQREVFVPRLWGDEPLRVLVFGPIADHKGWDILVQASERVLARRIPIEFHILGASEMGKPLPSSAALVNHGWFAPGTLSARIGAIAPHLAWYPSQVPETWCYSLNDGMAAGLPVVASAIGALIERCEGRPATWLLPPDSAPDAVIDLFEQLRSRAFEVEPATLPTDDLPGAEPFYFERYLAPARRRKSGRDPGK
ncbi:NAD-dependent epimerase/dehydratase family protein [Starkeya koreensis]|uniref:NAD-dependent epimerase/dehydratase family protein n=1 Tax=Ancylobacter koreensis TaxID=266121 RepID=A0ABT0DKG1_9HYPH|nr:NAD-dependent epimerase/dehydratase family protein [Ancylobacter koreensis]